MAGRSPFTDEFKAAYVALDAGGFATGWEQLADELADLCDGGGPHDAYATALDTLRKAAGRIPKGGRSGEQENLLAAASGSDKKAVAAKALVSRWFADAGSTPADIDAAVATLASGFKKIQAVLASGKLLLTDHPEVRNATTNPNKQFWQSEAFVKGAREGMDVVYIESAFFARKGSNTLSGLKNRARILVHELTHRDVGTVDKFCSWQGIKPDAAVFPMADALVNADSWAFFCVDAAGALTASERLTALQ